MACPALQGERRSTSKPGLCAGTFAFDYPSVKAAAKHVHSLMLSAAGSAAAAESGALASLAPAPQASSPGEDLLVSVSLVGQLPAQRSIGDAISSVPYGRWDLEAPRHGQADSLLPCSALSTPGLASSVHSPSRTVDTKVSGLTCIQACNEG